MSAYPPEQVPPRETFREPPGQYVPIRLPDVKPWVTYTLLVITILVYILQEASGFLFNGVDVPSIMGMKVNELIVSGEYWRLITPMFLHGSILHIAFNMYALFSLGPSLERPFGHWRFLALYLLSGCAGNVASFAFSAFPSLGSSTAIFGLIGAEGVFLYRNRKIFAGMAQRALSQIVMIAIINLVIGLSPGIDNWGHIGGLVGGTLFSWLACPLLAVEGISPALQVVDQRETRTVVLAALTVGGLIALAAAALIYTRSAG
ncbi:MAG: rhomboid family intramembrane serine protease [Chloroflexota bacterium]|nr:MAG: rhomboid family intramembrane serine protease [Chloroflexota bacterium]